MRRFLMSFFVAATLVGGLFAGSPVHATPSGAPSPTRQPSVLRKLPADSLRPLPPEVLAAGIELYEREQFDAAREKLVESTLSEDAEVRTHAFLYLSSLEMEAENFAAARGWLELYHTEALAVFRAKLEVEKRYRDGGGRWWIAAAVGFVAVVGAVAARFFARRRWAHQGPKNRPKPIDIASWQRYRADAEKFKQTEIYSEIVELASQKERGRSARVMTVARQEVLDRELAVAFSHFAARLQSEFSTSREYGSLRTMPRRGRKSRREFPALTPGEVKFCCLSLAGLSSWARALCLGSTETNIVKQRKHKLKAKLPTELIEFIFRS